MVTGTQSPPFRMHPFPIASTHPFMKSMKTLPSAAAPWLLTTAFAACGGHAATTSNPVPAKTAPPAPLVLPPLQASSTEAVTPHNAPKGPCESAREIATRIIASANLEQPKLVPFDSAVPVTGRCMHGKGGTWAIVLTSLTAKTDVGNGVGAAGTFELFHTDEGGLLTTVAPPPPQHLQTNYLDISGEGSLSLNEPILFDFDGDGSDEFIVYGSGGYHEGESFSFGTIWSFRGGAIVPYAPSANIAFTDVKDVTGDGRPDLLYPGAFDSVVESPCSGFGYRMLGPTFVAHAKADGTFSLDDEAAKDAARKACPSRPAKLVVRRTDDKDLGDEEGIFTNVACARVWGVSSAALKSTLVRECQSSKLRVECGDKPGTCPQQTELLSWASRKPPLQLAR